MNRGFQIVTVLVVLVFGGVFFLGGRLMKPVRTAPVIAAPAWPEGAPLPISPLEAALLRYVKDDGGADFAAWRADPDARTAVDLFLAFASEYSPRATPARFPTKVSRLRYWLLAAQAMQIKVILMTGATDVLALPAPLSAIPGDGLLRRFSFPLGGKSQTVLGLVRDFMSEDVDDPRLVFALGGVARALGPLARKIPDEPEFESFLAARTAAFFAEPADCAFSPDGKAVAFAPRIFLWRDVLTGVRPTPGGRDPDDVLRAVMAAHAPADIAAKLTASPPPAVRSGTADWRVR